MLGLDELHYYDVYTPLVAGSSKSYTYEEEKPFEITKEGGIWVVKGKKVEELFQMTRFTEEESVLRFARILKKMGVEDKLESLGAQRGDEVKMDYIFNFKE